MDGDFEMADEDDEDEEDIGVSESGGGVGDSHEAKDEESND